VCAARDLLSFLGDRHQIIVQTGVTDVTNLTADDALSEAEKKLKAKSEGLLANQRQQRDPVEGVALRRSKKKCCDSEELRLATLAK
jgi:hypothetical protein